MEIQLNAADTSANGGVIRLDGYSAPVANVTITFAPGMPSIQMPSMPSAMNIPGDVVKSMDEEKKPYGDDGCHFTEDGFCGKCGY